MDSSEALCFGCVGQVIAFRRKRRGSGCCVMAKPPCYTIYAPGCPNIATHQITFKGVDYKNNITFVNYYMCGTCYQRYYNKYPFTYMYPNLIPFMDKS